MQLYRVLNWLIHQHELILQIQDAVLGLSFVGPDLLRIRGTRGNKIIEEETFVVLQSPPALPFELKQFSDHLDLVQGRIRLEIDLSPLALRIRQDGKIILATPVPNMLEFAEDSSLLRFTLNPQEKIYGLGQDPMAKLNHRDQERRMWQEWGGLRRSGNAGIPFLISNQGYAMLLNSSWPARFAIGRAELPEPPPEFARDWAAPPWGREVSSGETNPDQMAIILDGGIMDVFIWCRPNVEDALAGYVDLTGHAPMLPKWALGYIQCKNRYRSQEELLHLAREFRRRNIPCDVLVIDWLWFKEFGDLHWLTTTFPDPKSAFRELEKMGFRLMQAQHPFIETTSQMYPIFKEKGYLNDTPAGARPSYDHSNPEARQAWWNEIRRLYEDGIRGYWTDMGELEVHPAGTGSFLGPRERVHNIYSLLWTAGLYEGQRRDFGTRVFSLPRTAFAGIQRNSAAMWSNDISSTWEVFKDQVVIGQGVCLSGQQFWCTDIGGFFPDENFSPELYIRWFEWGTFCPIFRTHGTRPDNEPWTFGSDAEQILAGFIRLRSRLMPYIYSLARRGSETGAPMMRSMLVDFPDDPVAVTQEHQFMFGPALLVAPVVEPGARSRRVYLPEGDWYDFWTDQKIGGRQWVDVPAPLDRIPLFVRAGSVIPMGPVLQYTDEKPLEIVNVHVYPGKAGSFELYEDDGLTFAYEEGVFVKSQLAFDGINSLAVGPVKGDASLLPPGRRYVTVVHSAHQPEPAIHTDCDLKGDGSCTLHALLSHPGDPAEVKATLSLPEGWRFRNGTAVQQGRLKDLLHLQWTVYPAAEALPIIHRAELEFIINQDGQSQTISRCVQWGSGWASRWQIAGHFDNSDGQGLERPTEVEFNPDLAEYQVDNRTIRWSRNLLAEFNPFGYVEFKGGALPDPGSQGVSYARSRVWTKGEIQAFLEITGDPNLKIWLNGEQIFSSSDIVLRRVLPQPFTLRKGWNPILVKAALNFEKPWSGREYGFTLRFVDDSGKVIEGLNYSPS
jgi:alpha-glucosidase (family GH31 glycosyl hydrolase)